MSSPASTLADLDAAAAIVRSVGADLGHLAARARAIADAADWQSPAARGFHERVETLRRRLFGSAARAEEVRFVLSRARAVTLVRAAGG